MTALAKIDGPQPDWFIIELQGLLEPKINKDEFIDKHGHVKVGRLSKNDEGYFLHIGTGVSKGYIEKLKQPIAILTTSGETIEKYGREAAKYAVSGIVREKLIFKQRPFPSRVAETESVSH